MRRLILTIWLLVAWCIAVDATTRSTDGSQGDVQTKINAASDGDIITIPEGNFTWTATITISKGIELMGAGKNLTTVTYGVHPLVQISSVGSDKSVAVHDIAFNLITNNTGGDRSAIYILGSVNNSYCLSHVRIYNNKFSHGTKALKIIGWFHGLVDHNDFINSNIAIYLQGDNTYDWARTIAAGTANATFIEDNTFTIDNNAAIEPNHQIYQQEAARSVVRHNTFDGSAYTTSGKYCYFYDSHGNMNYFSNSGSDMRGQVIIEVYSNHFHAYRAQGNCFQIRSGSGLIYNNDFVLETGTALIPYLYEEESFSTSMFPSGLRTVWPAQDNIANLFFWNNSANWTGTTANGSQITNCYVESPSSTFIQKDRDYFMHAPESSGGSTSYTGARNGGSTTSPTESDTGNTVFTAEGANAYYGYTGYTYPHPLQTVATKYVIFKK